MRLSVIIPGYNNPIWRWQRVLASVAAALGPEDEIICVDDGSTDGSGEWMEGVGGVRVLRRGNGGLAAARNSGLAAARGEYVAFVDSDDEILAGAYDAAIEALERDRTDVAVFGVRVVWPEDGLVKEDHMPSKRYGVLTGADIAEIRGKCLLNYAVNKVFRRSVLEDFELDGMPCEDIIQILRLIRKGVTWSMVDRIGYVYYHTHASLLSRYKPTNVAGLRKCQDLWLQVAPGLAIRDFEGFLRARERKNLCLPGSPRKFRAFLYSVARALYVRPVRRWKLKRMYPHARDL